MSAVKKSKAPDPVKDGHQQQQNLHQLDGQLGVLGIVILLFCGTLSSYLFTYLPDAMTRESLEQHPHAFIAERAWENLQTLNDFGPKPTGSEACEVKAAGYLKQELNRIRASKHSSQEVLFEHQIVSGGYPIEFLGYPLTSLYRNVQNMVVKLVGQGDKGNALMLNCHFDTVASSPGASDDGGSCAVMLEVLRVLSRETKRNEHSIIFLFNGAEETPLQAAHGFITQHRWAKEVRAFLNLESAGSGGKEQLFQSGPQHPWMIDVYARAIRHPAAQTTAEEIFQSGLIPSDTDFRIFRDFGNVPGMDFAHTINGYRYHTKYDNIDYLTMPVLQRTGDNILSLTREMANCEELVRSMDPGYVVGHSVYYDFLGLIFVHYTVGTARLINIVVSVLSCLVPYFGLCASSRYFGTRKIATEALASLLATVVGTVASVAVTFTIGKQLDNVGRVMTWYSTPYLVLGVYGCPLMLCHCLAHVFINRLVYDKKTALTLAQTIQARLVGVNLFWALLTIGLTIAGIRSAYVVAVMLLFSLLSSTMTSVLGYQNTVNKWLVVHLVFQALTILWATHFYHLNMKLFIPITARIGGERNPEYIVGGITALTVILSASYLFPLIGLLKRASDLTSRLVTFALIGFLIACFTQVGFPYRDDSVGEPSVQRHYVTHTLQIFRHEDALHPKTRSGFLFREMDRNALRAIQGVAKPKQATQMCQLEDYKDKLFCAVPFYSIWHQIRFENYWIPGPAPVVDEAVRLTYLEQRAISPHVRRYTFSLEGSILSSLIIAPRPGIKLINWNLMDVVPPALEYNGQKGHFVLITHGLSSKGWNVTMDFEHEQLNHDGAFVAINLVTTHWEYSHKHTKQYSELIDSFPTWAHVIPSVAVVDSQVF